MVVPDPVPPQSPGCSHTFPSVVWGCHLERFPQEALEAPQGKGGGAKEDLYHECSENPLTPGVHHGFECSSGDNLVWAQGQPVLAFNCLARVMNGCLWIWALHRAGRSSLMSQGTVGHSYFTACVQPAPVQHQGKGKTINLPQPHPCS